MAQGKNITGLTDLLLKCMSEPDPMFSMPEWLCAQLMEAEVSGIVGAEKNVHSPSRSGYRCGYRPRRFLAAVQGTFYAKYSGTYTAEGERRFCETADGNLALKKYEYTSAAKRNPSAIVSLDELGDCVSGTDSVESEIENKRIESAIDNFLWQRGSEKRNIFIRRYWYFDSIKAICKHTGFSESKVKPILYEMRLKLRKYLERERIEV